MTEKERSRQKFLNRVADQRAKQLANRPKPKRRRRRSDHASREEQHGTYIDTGYQAWDDK